MPRDVDDADPAREAARDPVGETGPGAVPVQAPRLSASTRRSSRSGRPLGGKAPNAGSPPQPVARNQGARDASGGAGPGATHRPAKSRLTRVRRVMPPGIVVARRMVVRMRPLIERQGERREGVQRA